MARRNNYGSIFQTLQQVSGETGVPLDVMRKFAGIESSFKPNAKTGSYKGLFQLSNAEFKRGGGKGNIYDPYQNASSFANVIKDKSNTFQKQFGRPPTGAELYLMHQQGEQGGKNHLTNPDQPAWKNMYATGEGRQKGIGWSKKAVWGNVPAGMKKQFGSVDNLSSRDFVNMWSQRYTREGRGGPWGQNTEVAGFDNTVPMPSPGGRKSQARLERNVADQPSELGTQTAQADTSTTLPNGLKFGGSPIDAETGKPYKPPSKFNMPAPTPDKPSDQNDRSIITPSQGRSRSTYGRSSDPSGGGADPSGGVPTPSGGGTSPVYGSASPSPMGSGRSWGDVFGQSAFTELYARPDQGAAVFNSLGARINAGLNNMPKPPPLFREIFGF